MSPPADKSAFLEEERARITPVGIASIVGGTLVLIATVTLLGTSADSDAERLVNYADSAGTLRAASLAAIPAYLLMSVPVLFLLRAAHNRGSQISRALLILPLIGALMLGAGTALSTFASVSVGEDFVEQAEDLPEERAPSQEQGAKKKDPESGSAATQGDDGSEDAPTGDEEGSPRDELAEELTRDSSTLSSAIFITIAGLLSFLFTSFYSARQAMRAGLLTRFIGTMGMAMTAVSILAQPMLSIWFVILGLTLLGTFGRGRPPAWESGEAIPWPDGRGAPQGKQAPADRAEELERAGLPPDPDAEDRKPDPDDPYGDVADPGSGRGPRP